MAEYNAAGELMPVASSGCVVWPTTLQDTHEGGMTALAFVLCDDAVPTAPGFAVCYEAGAPVQCTLASRVPSVLRPRDPVVDAKGFLGCLELGSSTGSFYDEARERYWECTRADLTPDGAALVAMLEKLYGRAVEIRTFIDT